MSSEVEIQPWSANEYANLALVQEVKKHPCLYNNTIPEYSQKDVTGRVWQEIADKFGCTVSSVKKQWMRLRSAYTKDLRKREKGKKTVHPLAPHMDFVHPFIVKYQQSNIHKSVQDNLSDVLHAKINKLFPVQNTELSVQNEELNEDIDYNDMEVTEFIVVEDDNRLTITNSTDLNVISSADDETEPFNTVENEAGTFNTVNNEDETCNTVVSGNCVPHTVNINSKSNQSLSLELNNNELEKDSRVASGGSINHVCHSFDQGNPRVHYVLSLLPEVDEMTERQFRFFKRKMLILIDEIKDAAM